MRDNESYELSSVKTVSGGADQQAFSSAVGRARVCSGCWCVAAELHALWGSLPQQLRNSESFSCETSRYYIGLSASLRTRKEHYSFLLLCARSFSPPFGLSLLIVVTYTYTSLHLLIYLSVSQSARTEGEREDCMRPRQLHRAIRGDPAARREDGHWRRRR